MKREAGLMACQRGNPQTGGLFRPLRRGKPGVWNLLLRIVLTVIGLWLAARPHHPDTILISLVIACGRQHSR